jgi:hypothetical protein
MEKIPIEYPRSYRKIAKQYGITRDEAIQKYKIVMPSWSVRCQGCGENFRATTKSECYGRRLCPECNARFNTDKASRDLIQLTELKKMIQEIDLSNLLELYEKAYKIVNEKKVRK